MEMNLCITLLWRHNERDSVSNHQRLYCLLKRLFRRRSKIISKLRVTGLCAWNSPGTGEFPAQKASNAENVSIWWLHHEKLYDVVSEFIWRPASPMRIRHLNSDATYSVGWKSFFFHPRNGDSTKSYFRSKPCVVKHPHWFYRGVPWCFLTSMWSFGTVWNFIRAAPTCAEYWLVHYDDVIMGEMASQITSLIVYSTVYSDADQSKHQSSASLAFVWEIPRTNGQ